VQLQGTTVPNLDPVFFVQGQCSTAQQMGAAATVVDHLSSLATNMRVF
jgi:hypothetical protein